MDVSPANNVTVTGKFAEHWDADVNGALVSCSRPNHHGLRLDVFGNQDIVTVTSITDDNAKVPDDALADFMDCRYTSMVRIDKRPKSDTDTSETRHHCDARYAWINRYS